jgi:hypothetical protein
MKKILWLGLTILLLLTSCGSEDSSKEARELQKKILNVVGIPNNIIATICQDDNKNSLCEDTELQAKITFNRGDSTTDIWQKISQTSDGKYFLETYDITKPILLVLKDSTVKFDGGKFTLNFDGFGNDKKKEEKELSILESMVDADTIEPEAISAIKKLDNKIAQDKFYNVLLNDLKSNINTLRTKGLDSKNSMKANIKEMADELLSNGIIEELPNKINSCGIKETCIDKEINKVSKELLITESEAEEIVNVQHLVNQAPTVNGGQDKSIKVNEEVKLEGTAHDSDGSITSYEWKEKDKVLATTASFNYRPTTVGKHTLILTVTDNDGEINQDSVLITVIAKDNNQVKKRLNKLSEYNESNIKITETTFVYENNRLVKWINNNIEDNQQDSAIFEYEANKTTVTYAKNEISWETLYKDNIILGWNSYYKDQILWSTNVLAYDNNRPSKIEEKDYILGEGSITNITITYDGNYLVNYKSVEESDNSSENYNFTYNRNYDCLFFNDLFNSNIVFISDEDECINWTSKKTIIDSNNLNNQEYTETQKITYDGKLPTRIDEYIYDSEMKENKHTYSIYEYSNSL